MHLLLSNRNRHWNNIWKVCLFLFLFIFFLKRRQLALLPQHVLRRCTAPDRATSCACYFRSVAGQVNVHRWKERRIVKSAIQRTKVLAPDRSRCTHIHDICSESMRRRTSEQERKCIATDCTYTIYSLTRTLPIINEESRRTTQKTKKKSTLRITRLPIIWRQQIYSSTVLKLTSKCLVTGRAPTRLNLAARMTAARQSSQRKRRWCSLEPIPTLHRTFNATRHHNLRTSSIRWII